MKDETEKSAGTVILREDPVLGLCVLLLQTYAKYDLPKGHVEKKDKTILDAAIRETYEECGFEVSTDPDVELSPNEPVGCLLRGITDPIKCLNVNNKTGSIKKIVYLFPVVTQCPTAVIRPNGDVWEHQSYRWFPISEIAKSSLHPYLQPGVLEAEALYRTHKKVDEAIRRLRSV